MARTETNKQRLISSAIGCAIPEDKTKHGYLSEHHNGKDDNIGSYAEYLANVMLNVGTCKTSNIFICTKGIKNKWTTAVAVAVLLE
jgi:pyruvoyl-dependent arginine decarboxylase (PvlArgDC)